MSEPGSCLSRRAGVYLFSMTPALEVQEVWESIAPHIDSSLRTCSSNKASAKMLYDRYSKVATKQLHIYESEVIRQQTEGRLVVSQFTFPRL